MDTGGLFYLMHLQGISWAGGHCLLVFEFWDYREEIHLCAYHIYFFTVLVAVCAKLK